MKEIQKIKALLKNKNKLSGSMPLGNEFDSIKMKVYKKEFEFFVDHSLKGIDIKLLNITSKKIIEFYDMIGMFPKELPDYK